jgi:hypothetical protein
MLDKSHFESKATYLNDFPHQLQRRQSYSMTPIEDIESILGRLFIQKTLAFVATLFSQVYMGCRPLDHIDARYPTCRHRSKVIPTCNSTNIQMRLLRRADQRWCWINVIASLKKYNAELVRQLKESKVACIRGFAVRTRADLQL